MLAALVVLLRSLALICCGQRAVAFENLALRQQLAVFRRTVKRSQLRDRDRLFWMLLANTWRDWRTALVVVHPDTVVRWHRQWLRRRHAIVRTPIPTPCLPSARSSRRSPFETFAIVNLPQRRADFGEPQDDVGEIDVAFFLPFGCNKDQQMAARADTRRRSQAVGVYERRGRIRQDPANRG